MRGVPESSSARHSFSSSALSASEEAILMRSDAGMEPERIADETGYSEKYVREVINRYSVTEQALSAFDRMTAAGSARLLRALHQFHPETRHGVDPSLARRLP